MPLSPGTRIGPYEVIALLGVGGMGEVYRARDPKLNRDVAVKVLAEVVATDPDRLARFRREAQVLASLNHPNIAHVYGVEDESSIHGLVMELVEGPTLADRVAQGPIPLDDALSIGRQITDALEAAHEQGIIHRDLKPANIKVRNDGTVKVLDFGLAKLVDNATASDVNVTASPTLSRHATMAGVILGTAAYMSPEQARGKAVDKRADIWAFGCVLYEMVTGRRAFGGDDVTETFAAIVRDQPDLSQVPAQLRRLLARCFEKDPRRRLRDIGDVWSLLEDEEQAQQQSVRLKPDATTRAWRRALPWAVTAAAAIAAVGVSVAHLTETRFVPHQVRFQVQIPDEAGSGTPALSPDGTHVAYRFGGQIWVRDLASVESRAIAPTDRAIGRLFWTADSRFVVYGAAGKLMRAPASGGFPETLGDQPLIVRGGFGLPDGGIVVSAASPASNAVETQRIDKTGPHALSGIGLDVLGGASLMPDGKRFVYPVFQPETRRGVYVGSIDNAAAAERILPDASDVAYVPSVHRGDEGYVLLQRQDALVALPVDAARLQPRGEPIVLAKGVQGFAASAGDSLVYRAAAGRRLAWYDRKGTPMGTAWSPGPFSELALSADGARVAVVRADGPPTPWVHDFARESSARVAPTLAAAIKPLWSPKGDRILVVTTRAGEAEFFSAPAKRRHGRARVQSGRRLSVVIFTRRPVADVHECRPAYEGRSVVRVGGWQKQTGALPRHRQQGDRRCVLARRPRGRLRVGRERHEQRVRAFVPEYRGAQMAGVHCRGLPAAMARRRQGVVLHLAEWTADERRHHTRNRHGSRPADTALSDGDIRRRRIGKQLVLGRDGRRAALLDQHGHRRRRTFGSERRPQLAVRAFALIIRPFCLSRPSTLDPRD